MEPSTTHKNTLEVEGKLLEFEMVSRDLSTTTLNSLVVSLMPSKWKHSISHKVESLISLLFSLKWAKWLSYSLGIGTTTSLKHIGIGSVSSTPCASFGEGKIPCSPFLTLSPSRLDVIRWASSLSSMVEGKIPCSTVLWTYRSSGAGRLMWHPAKPLLENRVKFVHCIVIIMNCLSKTNFENLFLF